MRQSTNGLHLGVFIHAKGAGKHAKGTISREPAPDATHVTYRSWFNQGERLAPIANVRIVRGPRL